MLCGVRNRWSGVVLAMAGAAVVLALQAAPAAAKARHPKMNADTGGLYVPPAPETKPVFVMNGALPKTGQLASAELHPHVAPLAQPSGPAMGKEAPPEQETRPNYPVTSIDSLSVPLLFR